MSDEDRRLILRCTALVAAVVITAIAASVGKAAMGGRTMREQYHGEPRPSRDGWMIVLAVLGMGLAAAMVGVAFAITNKTYRFF